MGGNENRDDCTTKIGSGEAVEKEDKRYQAKKEKRWMDERRTEREAERGREMTRRQQKSEIGLCSSSR